MQQRKKKRKQVYNALWDLDADEFCRMLNIMGVDGVALQFGCSRFTVWRATRANGLKRKKGGKYTIQPPNPNNPDEAEAHLKMLEARPRRGPSIVLLGDAQEIFGGGRPRERPLSFFCDHEWETLIYESPIPSLSTTVTRCRWCLGIRH